VTSGAYSAPGPGIANSISGSSVTYAKGGSQYGGGTAATANSGNGGNPATIGNSGVVIISYAGSQRGTGGTVTSSGGNTIHTFTSSGTYTA
jgi:hypothetical protein